MTEREALTHLRTMIRIAMQTHDIASVQKLLNEMCTLIEKTLTVPRRAGNPPSEQDYGGGDIVSVQRDLPTEDDQPLE